MKNLLNEVYGIMDAAIEAETVKTKNPEETFPTLGIEYFPERNIFKITDFSDGEVYEEESEVGAKVLLDIMLFAPIEEMKWQRLLKNADLLSPMK